MSSASDRVDAVQAAWRRELPDVDVGSIGIVGRLVEVVHHIERVRAVALAAENSDRATFDLLATLRRAGSPYRMTVGELQRASLVTTGAITQRVERAEAAGLVQRAAVPGDGRKVTVGLTATGFEASARLLRTVLAAEEAALKPLADADRERLVALLRGWSSALEPGG
ncbi:MarR family transcriptional regulator [Amycolatopsis acidiphila]|uniref:MarR family transcriptional regulator n=1 Tax=Amycolatopsis acidiphila TaxID=715473 RepID=A0A558ACQ2_9PSEU|nr:MarR family transcriptional regulator [Amycolatopsis acidiphila]TVT22052.1 MarR family transcriptional regulator [Amycolatopsis acidiphila]UIJ63629.1 MarR family transcriptional regulator [Amycolatopsis acidiphila]